MRWMLALLLSLASATPAFARAQKTLAYPRADAFATAVRFIRVDEGLKLIEKDGDAGYVLFELHEEKRTFRGSLEVIDVVQDDRHQVRFVITLADRPEWQELEMLGRLEQKLRAELGAPAPAPTKKDADRPHDKPREPEKPTSDEKREKPGDHPDEGPPISNTP
ncbi:MAG TPA: hypothetical protein VIV58_28395 [Kofleriaceae bacterium]